MLGLTIIALVTAAGAMAFGLALIAYLYERGLYEAPESVHKDNNGGYNDYRG